MPKRHGDLSQALFDTTGYQVRQKLIGDIEKITKRHLITYIALHTSPNAMIIHDDLTPIVDLLSGFDPSEPLDLMIHSPGGLPDAAETLLRTAFRSSDRKFRVIVPASAKSAATLLSLGADTIVMGENSQLGPIDPQVFVPQLGMMLPAKAVLEAYVDLTTKQAPTAGEITVIAQSLNAVFVKWCRQSMDRSKQLAEDWLATWMHSGDPAKANAIANELAEGARFTNSHGQVITWKDAVDIGLQIEHLETDDKLWKLIWELYVRTEVGLRQSQGIKAIETKTGGFTTPGVQSPIPMSGGSLEGQ